MHMPPPIHGASLMGKYIHDSELINQTFECRYINLAIAASIDDIQKFGLKKLFRYIILLFRILIQLCNYRPQLVYFTPNSCGKPFYKEFPIMMLLKLTGRKVVAHYHNKGVSTHSNRWLDNILYKLFFFHTKVILLSERLYPDMEKYVDREDVRICPNGIPTTKLIDYVQREGKNKVPIILFLSNLIPSKGVWVLLESLNELNRKGIEFQCIFAGGESAEIKSEDFIASIQNKGLSDKVSYYGPAYGQDKLELLKKADIFVFPTFYPGECFPLVLLEAMQCGLPCITTAEGGIMDIIEDGRNGLICKSHNIGALTCSIERLLKNPQERIEMGKSGKKDFDNKFAIEIFQQRITSLLS